MPAKLESVIAPSRDESGVPKSLPKTQRVAIATSHGAGVELKSDHPVPTPGPNDVLVHIIRTGVCHTDLHALDGDWEVKSKLPVIAGHEGAGVVVKVGENVDFLQEGDRVGVKWLQSTCGQCEFCLDGKETVCSNQQRTGFSCDGTFQEYAVASAAHVIPIPEGLSNDQAAPILCAGVTVYKGLKETEVKPGQWVVVSGAGGGLGHLAVQYARAMGMRVIAIDHPSKESFCSKLKAEAFVPFTLKPDELTQKIKSITNGGAHGALLAVASPEPYATALTYLRSWGTLVTLGLPKRGSQIPVDIFDTVMRRLTVRGSIVGDRKDAREAMEFAARGDVKVEVEVVGWENLKEVLGKMKEGKLQGRVVLDTSK
ncbi:alcohol dehydrogenase 2 [Fimicolochytrium jonesii]|uniref:alcohol dehydrogenase 2 n=1 Tax=Fimicolochytrium jonesii TaxID=1396493 RepID=UPI0022FF45D7|nr:alcohol dehydrogenase 2 [Fimicolochytrium jonesii]KAI8816374.1 alcohol dehydrogenase 2 [Fimicolochytrium jonesii]